MTLPSSTQSPQTGVLTWRDNGYGHSGYGRDGKARLFVISYSVHSRSADKDTPSSPSLSTDSGKPALQALCSKCNGKKWNHI